MFLKKEHQSVFVIILITLLGFYLRFHNYTAQTSWFDEWHSLFVADPGITYENLFSRYHGNEENYFLPEHYPPLYILVLRSFFNLFSYSDDVGRIFSLIFGTASLPLVAYLSYQINSSKSYVFSCLITSLNIFLIWQSLEIRAHSFLVFNALLNLIIFFKIYDTSYKKNFLLLLYFISSLFLLSLWPITLAIFFSKLIFILFEYFKKNKIKNFNLFILINIILSFYIIINYRYLFYQVSRDWHYTLLYKTFFYNFHFRTFFGSIELGAVYLIIFFMLIMSSIKTFFLNTNAKLNLILLIILSSYFLTLTYSLFRASVMSPKYVIFILPLIIIWISIRLDQIKIKKIFWIKCILVFITIVNVFVLINKNPIERPPVKDALKIIAESNIKLLFSNESNVFNNYLKINKIFKDNKLVLIDKNSSLKIEQKIWFICLNNPRFALGNIGSTLPDDEKCILNNKDLLLIKEVRLPDLILRQYKIN